MVLLLLVACGDRDRNEAVIVDDIADYHQLADGESWTWRDDGDGGEPDEEQVLRARYRGDGEVEIRRGLSWSSGEAWGSLAWDTSEGLELLEWELGDEQGEGPIRLADGAPEDGDRHDKYGWLCITDAVSDIDTYYATFDDALTFDCEPDDGGDSWSFSFGRDTGLVLLEGPGLTLDMVAAW